VSRILLADDDDLFRPAVRRMLEEAGFDVVEAKDGNEAVRSYRAQPTPLVVCDMFMPGKDGLETIMELRRAFSGVRIIAMSSSGFNGTVNVLPVARRLGALEVLHKPFDSPALLAAVKRAMAAA
jgi:CheY-like chemotaxis protein